MAGNTVSSCHQCDGDHDASPIHASCLCAHFSALDLDILPSYLHVLCCTCAALCRMMLPARRCSWQACRCAQTINTTFVHRTNREWWLDVTNFACKPCNYTAGKAIQIGPCQHVQAVGLWHILFQATGGRLFDPWQAWCADKYQVFDALCSCVCRYMSFVKQHCTHIRGWGSQYLWFLHADGVSRTFDSLCQAHVLNIVCRVLVGHIGMYAHKSGHANMGHVTGNSVNMICC